jgi:hypothetical protein
MMGRMEKKKGFHESRRQYIYISSRSVSRTKILPRAAASPCSATSTRRSQCGGCIPHPDTSLTPHPTVLWPSQLLGHGLIRFLVSLMPVLCSSQVDISYPAVQQRQQRGGTFSCQVFFFFQVMIAQIRSGKGNGSIQLKSRSSKGFRGSWSVFVLARTKCLEGRVLLSDLVWMACSKFTP